MREPAPASVVALAQARAAARARRDWTEADRLRAEIEGAGWKVVDEGLSFSLRPTHAPDVVLAGRARYGHATGVPSRLTEAAAGVAAIVLLAGDDPDEVSRVVAAAHAHAPAGTSLVVVADAPSASVEAALEGAEARMGDDPQQPIEVILTSERLGHAAIANAGMRRAAAPVVVILGEGVEPVGDVVAPLVGALEDPAVAVAGAPGIATTDLRHLDHASPGPAQAIGLRCLAFRRDDFVTRGPLDEHLRTDEYLATWWSLVLRDEGRGAAPRRAVALDLPLLGRGAKEEPAGGAQSVTTPSGRAGRRDYYRLLERFGGRQDLLGPAAGPDVEGSEGGRGA